MENLTQKKKGFYTSILIVALMGTINLITTQMKTLFVEETGKFEVFGGIALLLVVGLFFKWKRIRIYLETYILITLVFSTLIMFNVPAKSLVAYGFLNFAILITLLIVHNSKALRVYLKE